MTKLNMHLGNLNIENIDDYDVILTKEISAEEFLLLNRMTYKCSYGEITDEMNQLNAIARAVTNSDTVTVDDISFSDFEVSGKIIKPDDSNELTLSVKKISDDAVIPSRATQYSAGMDLYAVLNEPVTIHPHEIIPIHTGCVVSPSRSDIALCIFARSGLATKHSISLANGVGLVDSDYRGEIIVPLINHGLESFTIEPGMRVAQLVAMPIYFANIVETVNIDDTDRGNGGFGSTGK